MAHEFKDKPAPLGSKARHEQGYMNIDPELVAKYAAIKPTDTALRGLYKDAFTVREDLINALSRNEDLLARLHVLADGKKQ